VKGSILERFKVPKKDQVRVPEQSLRETVTALFQKLGVTPRDAAKAADVLVMADLRGVDSHGVSNRLRGYVREFNDGTLNPMPHWRILREFPGTATIDGDRALGIILGHDAMRMAMDKARKVGIGVVTVRNTGHLGAVGYFAMMAAKEDMVGMCSTATTGASMLPTFAAEPRLGSNPIAFAAPARKEAPVLFDAATAAVAGNKFALAARAGNKLPPGTIADQQGNPIMEEVPVPQSGTGQRILTLPLGATREQGSHKGYGLNLLSEVLTTFLSGALPSMLNPSRSGSGYRHYFAAYDIAAFTDVDEFKDNMDRMLQTLKNTPPAPGHQRVLYPGLPEHEEEQERRANGIPLHREVVQWFDDIASELSIPHLKTM
jgi:LDH2 family malate/lactate/ureidoglycolate dehydrogenase